MNIYASTAMAPGMRHIDALLYIEGRFDAGIPVSLDKVQLCPQNTGALGLSAVERLRGAYPETEFRLHATCRLERSGYQKMEASTPYGVSREYFTEMGELSRELRAPAYTLHAGKREESSLAEMRENILRLQELFGHGCLVGVEHMYPSPKKRTWLLDCWDEMEWLYESGINYALDLSHLNIIARRERFFNWELVLEMIQSERCLEIHISDNDGRKDAHQPINKERLPAWWRLIENQNIAATIFTESNLLKLNKPQLIGRKTPHWEG